MSTTDTRERTWGGHWISDCDRLAIYLRDHFTCAYCGRDLSTAKARDLSLDHLRPRSKGGSHDPSNLVTACLSCNSKRGNRPWRNYAPGGALERILRQIRRNLNRELARAIIRGEIDRDTAAVEAARAF